MLGILKCFGEGPHRVSYQKRQASATVTYQAILKMHILLLKVWNQNFLTAFGTTPAMFYVSYLLKRTFTIICDSDLIPLPFLQNTTS